MRQKPLMPSLREKKRYLAYTIHTQRPLSRHVGRQVIERLNLLLGIFDAAKAGVQPVLYNEQSQKGILRTSVAAAAKVRSAMLLITELGNVSVMIRPLKQSGVLQKMKNEIG